MDFNFESGEVLFVYKPYSWTSFDVVRYIRSLIKKYYQIKPKTGHAGTLDPYATGLIIICTGKFTKQIYKYQELPKTYRGMLKLGETTPSYDLETKVDQVFDCSHVRDNEILSVAESFTGEIFQVPPIFSAVKIEGKRAYDMARKGHNPKLESRKVTIYDFKVTEICMPFVRFEVTCSKGTYIRSLVSDFGKLLKTGAHLVELERTKIGDYSTDQCLTIEQLTEMIQGNLKQL